MNAGTLINIAIFWLLPENGFYFKFFTIGRVFIRELLLKEGGSYQRKYSI